MSKGTFLNSAPGFLLLLLAGLTGCAAGGPGRGNLSEAAAEAAESDQEADREPEEDRIWKVGGEEQESEQMGPYVDQPESGPGEEGDFLGPDFQDIGSELFGNTWEDLVLWYSRSRLAGDTPPGFSVYSFMLSKPANMEGRMHIGLYYGRGRDAGGRDIQEIFRWVTEWGFEVGGRSYLTPDHSLFGLYGMVGIRTGGLFWSYTRAIQGIDDDGDTNEYSHDAVLSTTPYAGLGVSLLQSDAVDLGVNATVGFRWLVGDKRTYHDFDNDLFKNVWEYKVNFEVKFTVD